MPKCRCGVEKYYHKGTWYCPNCDDKPDLRTEEERKKFEEGMSYAG